MPVDTLQAPVSGTRLWVGRIFSALPALMLLFSAAMKLMNPPEVETMFVGHLGWPMSTLMGLAILEITCTVIYLIPRTAVLGAILLTGYLGGAIATHVRVGDPFLIPLILGMFVWAGLYFRDSRVPVLLPITAGGAPL